MNAFSLEPNTDRAFAAKSVGDYRSRMANGIFLHRSDSLYDDVPSEKYQFPKQYKSRVDQCIGDWIVYLEPSKVKESRGYFGVAKVQMVIEDPDIDGMFVALMEPNSYLDLATPVAFNGEHGIVEQSVLNNEGRISGRAQAAVRIVPTDDFVRIVELGLADEALLPRSDQSDQSGFNDAQEPFSFDIPHERRVEQQLISRPIRDRAFRRTVLRAYCERCAMTGLKIINGGGRAEVEAAHIKPVEHDGPDIVSNGLALSGTAHWMFDRGLLGVDDSLGIMISRHVNDVGAVTGLINDSQKLLLPSRQNDRPHPIFLRWHRENCFKH